MISHKMKGDIENVVLVDNVRIPTFVQLLSYVWKLPNLVLTVSYFSPRHQQKCYRWKAEHMAHNLSMTERDSEGLGCASLTKTRSLTIMELKENLLCGYSDVDIRSFLLPQRKLPFYDIHTPRRFIFWANQQLISQGSHKWYARVPISQEADMVWFEFPTRIVGITVVDIGLVPEVMAN